MACYAKVRGSLNTFVTSRPGDVIGDIAAIYQNQQTNMDDGESDKW